MKTLIITLIITNCFLAAGYFYGTYKRHTQEFDLQDQILHDVRCIDEYGNLESYRIVIPKEVKNLEKYSKGFCDSLDY